jgi:LacI family transcriptional regulator
VEAAEMMAQHLLDQGYARIAFVANRYAEYSWQRQRHQGYRNALSRAGRPPSPDQEFVGGELDDAAYDRLAAFVAGGNAAVFAASDAVALRLRDALTERRLEAPDDYGLAGYDNIADEVAGRPVGLTSIGFPREHMGARALRLVRELADDPTLERQHIYVVPELHVRQSTVPAR